MLADTSTLPSRSRYIFSQGGYPIGRPEPERSYWAVRLTSGKWLCELDQVDDLVRGPRNLDWTLDLVSTGDLAKVDELWMICPPTALSPTGNTARLPIERPGTAFQFKVGVLDTSLGASLRRPLAQIIGRVIDEETGECEAFVFDYGAQALVVGEDGPWKTNVYNMGTWRPNIPGTPSVAPIGRLSLEVLGLHFGDRLKWKEEYK